MGYSNGIVSAPVTMADVQSATGNMTTDLGNLCRGININMWAKYKPVIKAIIDTTGQLASDKTWNPLTLNPWWTATDGNYGLTFTEYNIGTGYSDFKNTLTTLANAINGGNNGWAYAKPTGGANAPYRLTDFNQYNNKAPRPVKIMGNSGDVTASNLSVWEFSLQYMESDNNKPVTDRDFIMPTDITSYSLYKGIAIFKKDSNNQYEAMAWATGNVWNGKGVKSASTPDGITGSGPDFDEATFKSGGTYYALPVLFSADLTQVRPGQSIKPTTGTPYPIKVIPYPNTTFVEFTCTQAASSQRVGLPVISNHKILPPITSGGNGVFATKAYLDSSVDTSWYTDHNSHTVVVGVVNELWNGTWAQNTYASMVTKTIAVPANTKYEVTSWGGSEGYENPILYLSSSHTWYVVFIVDGSTTKISLISAPDPYA